MSKIDGQPRAGIKVLYRTIEQVEGRVSRGSNVQADVDQVVAAVAREGSAGVRGGKDAVAKLAGMRAESGRAAVEIALSRGLIENRARRKDGGANDHRPHYFVADMIRPHAHPPKGADGGRKEAGSSPDGWDE
jgi:hypothetical protein